MLALFYPSKQYANEDIKTQFQTQTLIFSLVWQRSANRLMVPKRTIKVREANIVNVSKTQKDKKAYKRPLELQFTEIHGSSLNIGVTIMYLLRLFTMFVCTPFSTETNPFGWKLVRWRFYQKQSALKSVKIQNKWDPFHLNGKDINGWTLSYMNAFIYGQKYVRFALQFKRTKGN